MKVLKSFAVAAAIVLIVGAASPAKGQVHSSSSYVYMLHGESTAKHLEFLASPLMAGRASGTPQAREVAGYISREFESYGLQPFKSVSFLSPFNLPLNGRSTGEDSKGYNVVGYLPATRRDAGYIIIGAHFDHIGAIDGKFYPGADDNASGVASLLEIAKAFGARYAERGDLGHNLVFVAFDGNNYNLQGSRSFLSHCGIPKEKITCMINMDQIGSTLAPPGKEDEYILVLGTDKLAQWQKEQLSFANTFFGIGLQIDFTYYGSEGFYNIFYRLSDQQSFTAAGIPALLFTSGITHHTNKESDTVENLNIKILQKRIELIYRFLWLII